MLLLLFPVLLLFFHFYYLFVTAIWRLTSRFFPPPLYVSILILILITSCLSLITSKQRNSPRRLTIKETNPPSNLPSTWKRAKKKKKTGRICFCWHHEERESLWSDLSRWLRLKKKKKNGLNEPFIGVGRDTIRMKNRPHLAKINLEVAFCLCSPNSALFYDTRHTGKS